MNYIYDILLRLAMFYIQLRYYKIWLIQTVVRWIGFHAPIWKIKHLIHFCDFFNKRTELRFRVKNDDLDMTHFINFIIFSHLQQPEALRFCFIWKFCEYDYYDILERKIPISITGRVIAEDAKTSNIFVVKPQVLSINLDKTYQWDTESVEKMMFNTIEYIAKN
jgi:hypothetical protein